MTDEKEQAPKLGGRIEGGFDAIVIGASLDALAAAGLLGKAGLKTILLGAGGPALDDERREFAPGFFCIDGEHLVTHLDPALAETLELYRHGLSFASRRIDTVYYFSDDGALHMDGDLYNTRESIAAMTEDDADAYAEFLEAALDAARALRPFFDAAPAPALSEPLSSAAERFLSASVDDIVESTFTDWRLKALLSAEASLRSGLRPSEPFGFASLIRRWAGEAAGLQGAAAYPVDGARGVKMALRRAAQAGGVDFRPSTGVRRVLVEWDAVAGVETTDGGQIRAPIIVSALPARKAFIDFIGPSKLDIEFQMALASEKPRIASAWVNFALTGEPSDERTRANLARRLVYAPDQDELRRAYSAARRGEVEAPLIMEALIPSAFDKALAPEKGHVVSAIAHPVPFSEEPDARLTKRIKEAARKTFERMAPGATGRIVAVDVRLPADEAAASGAPAEGFAATSSMIEMWARARKLAGASRIEGYYFCGPEAEIGPAASGAAGRRAAEAAMRYSRKKAAA